VCIAVCCSVLLVCGAAGCNVLQCVVGMWCSVVQCVVADAIWKRHSNKTGEAYMCVLQCVVVCCSVLQCVAVCCR